MEPWRNMDRVPRYHSTTAGFDRVTSLKFIFTDNPSLNLRFLEENKLESIADGTFTRFTKLSRW